jgi:hypothetical protein
MPADPAEHAAIRVAGDPTHLSWFKCLFHFGSGRCEIGPGIGRVVTKSDNQRVRGLFDGHVITRLKVRNLHAIVPQSSTLQKRGSHGASCRPTHSPIDVRECDKVIQARIGWQRQQSLALLRITDRKQWR